MAANTVTSKTGVVAAVTTDILFSATFKLAPRRQSGKVTLFVKYTKVTSDCVMTFDIINPLLGTTDKYRILFTTEDDDTAELKVTVAATKNVRIPLDISPGEGTLVVNITLATTGAGDTVVIECMEE